MTTTRRITRTIALWMAIILGCTLFVLAAPPHPADAATTTFTFSGSDFLIPRPEARAPIGELRPVASFDVVGNGLGEYVGSACTFVVTAANGSSVHINNQGFLTTNGSSTDVLRTEDEPNVLRTVLDDPTLRLGETVELSNILGEWAEGNTTRRGYVGTSVEYEVKATCTIEQAITTTTSTSTTAPPSSTTTTAPSTSTTTMPSGSTSTTIPASTTSTTAPTGSTTSTLPPSTSTTSTIPPGTSTSTTVPRDSTSTSLIEQDTSTTTQPTTDETLPFTGPPVEAAGMVMAGLALLVLGGAVLMAVRAR